MSIRREAPEPNENTGQNGEKDYTDPFISYESQDKELENPPLWFTIVCTVLAVGVIGGLACILIAALFVFLIRILF